MAPACITLPLGSCDSDFYLQDTVSPEPVVRSGKLLRLADLLGNKSKRKRSNAVVDALQQQLAKLTSEQQVVSTHASVALGMKQGCLSL
jgi:hypothetical protein